MTILDAAKSTALKADLGQRLGLVRGAMREQGLDGLLVYHRGQHHMLRMDQVFYLTDFRSVGEAALVVPLEGRPRLIVSPQWDLPRAAETPADLAVQGVASDRFLEEVTGALGAISGHVGLAGRDVMSIERAGFLIYGAGRELANADRLITQLAATRTSAELERISRAATIADQGFEALCEAARVGMTEYELAAEVDAAMRSLGAEDNFGLIAGGSHNIAIRTPTDRRLEAGDVIISEITPMYRGYLAQLCRTFVLGRPTSVQFEKYDLLIEALKAACAAAVPGKRSSEIARAANEVIGGAGYAEYCKPPYMRTRGHSLGLGAVIPSDINEDGGPELRVNMTMVIHPNQYVPETGYIMLGDTVVIEEDGPRPLTKTPIELHWRSV